MACHGRPWQAMIPHAMGCRGIPARYLFHWYFYFHYYFYHFRALLPLLFRARVETVFLCSESSPIANDSANADTRLTQLTSA